MKQKDIYPPITRDHYIYPYPFFQDGKIFYIFSEIFRKRLTKREIHSTILIVRILSLLYFRLFLGRTLRGQRIRMRP